ncbi:hypothetical protein MMC10_007165 [Thelotrema lepadinum]|nr:hypothetical protein [Thelotrema lepadinum]
MDLMVELDNLAHKAAINDDEPSENRIRRWMSLFSYPRAEAISKIQQRNTNLSRLVITHDHWASIQSSQEAIGFDKDAYEHFLESRATQVQAFQTATVVQSGIPASKNQKKSTYLMKLSGAVSTPQQVQALLDLSEPPEVKSDDDDSTVRFIRVSATQRATIISKVTHKPLFIALTLLSKKDFDPNSRHPTLGIDSTLPQHRLNTSTPVHPLQDEYPVWYFFYGNLAKPKILGPRLGIVEEDVELHPARVRGGRLGTWSDKYRALLDGESEDTVEGFGFLVRSVEDEDKLRTYETDAYEVVRCEMDLGNGEAVPSCTFRFCGQ